MDLATLTALLGWCAVINVSLLMIWFGLFVFAGDALFRLHGRWFALTRERYDTVHLSCMAGYKLAIWMFNLAPYLALRIIG